MNQRTNTSIWGYVLLAIGLLLAAAWVLYRITNPPVAEDPWADYVRVDAAAEILPGMSADMESVLREYNAGAYRDVSQKLPLLLMDSTQAHPITGLYYLGLSYLGFGEAYSAIYQLEAIPTDHPLRPRADYYRGVAYWLTGNSKKGRTILRRIADSPDHPEVRRAQAILASEL